MRKIAFVVFTFVIVAMLGKLGFWQLSRGAEKLKLQQQVEETAEGAAISDLTLLPTAPLWHRVSLVGVFDNSRPILLDNQLNNGRVGYHLYLPFRTQERWLLVNLGWLAAPPYREMLPVIPTFHGEQTITGIIAPASSLLTLKQEVAPTQWPLRVQNIGLTELATVLDRNLPTWVIQISATNPVALKQNWQPVVMKADKHYGYAMQWFVMAFAVLGMAGWWLLRESD
ncbi:SURF1 family protein [Photobacterium leiognathi]|uniref:SURF1 family protein n=1 Tax=Photobacterium leiognathi TaxID=553611 RepID=UPI002981E547|nr:SURF1 family protein [Photobacterium leiognathi]